MFANITQADKEAFFSLLDEYFATRGGVAAVAAAKGPVGQQALAKLQTSAGHLKTDITKAFGGPAGHASSTAAASETTKAADTSSSAAVDNSDRPSFAALRGAFSNASTAIMSGAGAAGLGRSNTSATGTGGPKVPPPIVPRTRFQAPIAPPPAAEPEEEGPPPPVIPRRTVAAPAAPPAPRVPAGLQSGKHIGSSKIDITSGGSILSSMIGSRKAPTTSSAPSPPPPSAPKAGYGFAPPPVRRAPSSTASETPAASTPPPPPPPPPPPTSRAQVQEEEGEWVEALYEYTSDDKADLQFDTGARIKVVDHTSDDWWTGELNGKQGLFPASYVKPA